MTNKYNFADCFDQDRDKETTDYLWAIGQMLEGIANETVESNRLKRIEIKQNALLQINDFKLKGFIGEVIGLDGLDKLLENEA